MNTQTASANALKTKLLAAVASILLCAGAHASNLVTNGDFETGDFTGWTTQAAGAGSESEESLFGVDGNGPHNGSYSAYFGATAPYDTISQTIATTAGQSYTISFYLDSEGTQGGAAGFIGSFGGTTFVSLNGSDADRSFGEETVTVQATSASTVLSFGAYDTSSYYTLDDVNVSAVPEPSSLGLFSLGVLGLGLLRRKSRRAD